MRITSLAILAIGVNAKRLVDLKAFRTPKGPHIDSKGDNIKPCESPNCDPNALRFKNMANRKHESNKQVKRYLQPMDELESKTDKEDFSFEENKALANGAFSIHRMDMVLLTLALLV